MNESSGLVILSSLSSADFGVWRVLVGLQGEVGPRHRAERVNFDFDDFKWIFQSSDALTHFRNRILTFIFIPSATQYTNIKTCHPGYKCHRIQCNRPAFKCFWVQTICIKKVSLSSSKAVLIVIKGRNNCQQQEVGICNATYQPISMSGPPHREKAATIPSREYPGKGVNFLKRNNEPLELSICLACWEANY